MIGISIDNSAACDDTEYMSIILYFVGSDEYQKTALFEMVPVVETTAEFLIDKLVSCSVLYISIKLNT